MAEVLTHNQTFASPQEALAHHGVKGMKWGVRNEDRPAGAPSARQEKKQEKRDVKVGQLNAQIAKTDVYLRELDAKIAATKPGIRGAYPRAAYTQQKQESQNYRDHLEKTAQQVSAGKLTSNQKRLIIGGAIAGGLVLAAYGSTKVQTGELNSYKLRGQAALRGKKFEFKKNDAFAKAKTPDEVLAMAQGINPNYKNAGGAMNCRRCTFAYELRRRGFDVTATASEIGAGQSETGLINALTPGKKNVSRLTSMSSMVVSGSKNIRTQVVGDTRRNPAHMMSVEKGADHASVLAALRKQPPGARGEAVFNFGGFGHSLSYERFGDKTFIFDNQKGTRYNMDDPASYESFVSKWSFGGKVKNVEITRLDNLQLDHKFLSRWATNAKPKSASQVAQEQSRARADLAASQAKVRRRAAERKTAEKTLARYNHTRPADMHIITWNGLLRKAGMTP